MSNKMNEFNELHSQVNELGHYSGIFHYAPVDCYKYPSKKIIVVANIISEGKDTENRHGDASEQGNRINMDGSAQIYSGIQAYPNN